jgi:ribonucleoside-diphosphate reductase alpha chain
MSFNSIIVETTNFSSKKEIKMNKIKFVVVKRNGNAVAFNPEFIKIALTKAFVDEKFDVSSSSVHDRINSLTEAATAAIVRNKPSGGSIPIEDIQDQVELALMRAGEHQVARGYVIFREKRASARASAAAAASQAAAKPAIHVKEMDGTLVAFDKSLLLKMIKLACDPFPGTDAELIAHEVERSIYDGVPVQELRNAIIMASRMLIERDPVYDQVTAQLFLQQIRREVGSDSLVTSISAGVEAKLLNPELLKFDLVKLQSALKFERDQQFTYLGIQTLFDRYFHVVHDASYDENGKKVVTDRRVELPQTFFMRVAMGLALNESDRELRAIEFYEVLSSFDFMSSTPTLFNSGSLKSQLSSCYLTTIDDSLESIYGGIRDNAFLSKWAGGLGNDWTPVRAMGARIKGTNGQSQGVIPFLKVVNDTAVAVNQGGKRKGAVCAYLETWHLDIEEFLDLRKNTGDDRRRCHDMNTANWIPDLFMKRVMEGGNWTLFTPNEVPELHDLFGDAFEAKYTEYEALAASGEVQSKSIPATSLWRKMLTMLFETGHPWIAFKDPCNIRSPQQHAGVVHSSNLCTEITLNTSATEVAVCNLGSVNLVNHVSVVNGKLVINSEKLRRTVRTAMRMLDNVVDINFYPVPQAETSNLKHRPVGMGIMGFHDVLYLTHTAYASQEAVKTAGLIMEEVAYFAYEASSDLASERGVYSSYEGSLWSKGILPRDSLDMLAQARKGYLNVGEIYSHMDWDVLRSKILKQGMRNSNCLAIAPTATISNIIGVSACIEPTYQNLYVKSNLSGEFTVINHYLVRDLKKLGLWDEVMIADLKYFDGKLAKIDRIPANLKQVYATAFEIEPTWLIDAAAQRQVWIDQAQSLNIYIGQPSGKLLDSTYKHAWIRGLKTTYYLRSQGATSAEKSTSRIGELNAVHSEPVAEPKFCSIDNPECESCQ